MSVKEVSPFVQEGAEKLLQDPILLERAEELMERLGLCGEEVNRRLVFLAEVPVQLAVYVVEPVGHFDVHLFRELLDVGVAPREHPRPFRPRPFQCGARRDPGPEPKAPGYR